MNHTHNAEISHGCDPQNKKGINVTPDTEKQGNVADVAAVSTGSPQSCTHPNAKYEDDEYGGLSGGGDYEVYKCPDCGKRIYVELPD